MKKNVLMFVVAVAISCTASVFAFTSPANNGCFAQCRVAYDKCVKVAGNPGGLNHCGKTFQACTSSCR